LCNRKSEKKLGDVGRTFPSALSKPELYLVRAQKKLHVIASALCSINPAGPFSGELRKKAARGRVRLRGALTVLLFYR
jgi:hypothetical protein